MDVIAAALLWATIGALCVGHLRTEPPSQTRWVAAAAALALAAISLLVLGQ